MLCVPLIGPHFNRIQEQIKEASFLKADLLEFRLDLIECSLDELKTLRESTSLPVLFTLRGQVKKFKELAELKPDYFDVDYDLVHEIADDSPEIKRVISYHNFDETPADLDDLLRQMRTFPATFYKLACFARSTSDALRLLDLVQKHSDVIAMPMGEKGKAVRHLAPVKGCPWVFAALSENHKTAPGQLTIKELLSFHKGTSLYGLIGGTVNQSISDMTHNKVMQEKNLQSLYVKIPLENEELESFMLWAKRNAIKGLSVTIPLKEIILPYLDVIDEKARKIGAVNTVVFQEGKTKGYNTDGDGALDAIESHMKVAGKKVVILGAGGAAKALVYEALQRGADVSIVNRSKERRDLLAKKWNIESRSTVQEYDVLINATSAPLPIDPKEIQPNTLVMDVKTIPQVTPFLKEAKEKGCRLVYGYEMFINQALGQFSLWFPSYDRKSFQAILKTELSKYIDKL